MSKRTQKSRLISIKTPLGEDVLLLTAVNGHEALSKLFRFQLELVSENNNIQPEAIVGKAVTISLANQSDDPRHFNGVISQFVAGELRSDGYRSYHAEIVPWLWFLSYTQNCKIYQNKTTVEIVQDIFNKHRGKFTLKLNENYVKREYCVQYNETDFQFISRLLEEEGIFYYFEHDSNGHTLVLADNKAAYFKCSEYSVEYSIGHLASSQLNSWSNQYSFITGKHTQSDYNFETPRSNLNSSVNSVVSNIDNTKFERYTYPGNFSDKSAGGNKVKVRIEEEEALYHIVNSGSTYKSFTAGGIFKIKEHVCDTERNKTYIITSITHEISDNSYSTAGGSSCYQNKFTCIPSDVLFRPGLKHHKPSIHGPQTAKVVGPKGEEIYTDKYGRVKVQFHWDRDGKLDERSSCWIRVAQTMVGNKWGALFIPRIDQEVVVNFIDGDVDRPLITGSVYNAEFMPPYDLPSKKTQSGFKTRSSSKGDSSKFNELRFEDKKGNEEIYFHAERDFNRVVENDDSLLIYKNRSKTIKEGNETVVLQKGNQTTTLNKGDMDVKLDSGKITLEASNSIELKVGGSSIHITPTSIEIKNGSNSVKIDPAGVSTKGTTVQIAGQALTEIKSPMTAVKGDGALTLKGGVTMIN